MQAVVFWQTPASRADLDSAQTGLASGFPVAFTLRVSTPNQRVKNRYEQTCARTGRVVLSWSRFVCVRNRLLYLGQHWPENENAT